MTRRAETITDRLEAAKAEVARIEREIAAAPCKEVGHRWKSIGGANCGCKGGNCSVPVYECTVCKDCDYGENAEAAEKRKACAEETAYRDDPFNDESWFEDPDMGSR